MTLDERITTDFTHRGGRPCIRETNIGVSDVLGLLAGGSSLDGLLEDLPMLEHEDLPACFQFASERCIAR